jgi:hypothetical protein
MYFPSPKIYTYDFHAIKEKQQYAVVEVLSNYFEKINLFLSFSSLDFKPKNVTLVIPLKSIPKNVDANKLSSKEFLEKYKFNEIEKQIERQSLSKFIEDSSSITSEYLKNYLISSLLTPLYFAAPERRNYFIQGAMPEAVGRALPEGVEYIKKFEFEGGSMEIYKVESGATLGEFVKQYKDLEMPENLKEAVDNYKTYYIALLNLEVLPIEEYDILEKSIPNTLEELVNYIKANPDLTFNCTEYRYRYPYKCDEREIIREKFSDFIDKAKIEARNKSIPIGPPQPQNIGNTIIDFILSAYSNSTKGTEVSVELPIKNEIYYPLGTGAAWQNPIEDIRVLVKMDENLEASFENMQEEVLYNGKRYYLWNFKNWNPDYDIVGKINMKSFLTFVSDSQKKLVIAMNENIAYFGIAFFVLSLVIAIFVVNIVGFMYFKERRKYWYKRLALPTLFAIFSPLVSLWLTLFLPVILKTEFKKEELKNYGRKIFSLLACLFVLYIVLSVISILL